MSNTERPPLWRVMGKAYDTSEGPEGDSSWQDHHGYTAEIRAVAQYLEDHGLLSTTGTKATPGGDARLLEALEQEARRAEAGE